MSKNKQNKGPAKKEEAVPEKKVDSLFCKKCNKEFTPQGKDRKCKFCKKDTDVIPYSEYLKSKETKAEPGKDDKNKGKKKK